jgi:hypothetical protein
MRRSAPPVLKAWQPVRKVALARAWSPAPSPFASAFRCISPDRTCTCCRTRCSGSRIIGSSNASPVARGVQSSMFAPFGT